MSQSSRILQDPISRPLSRASQAFPPSTLEIAATDIQEHLFW